MTTRRTALAAMAGALMLSGAAYSQLAIGNAATDDQGLVQRMFGRHPPSPETMQHLLDGRIAMVKTALKLTADQEKLWAPVEQAIRDNAAARAKAMTEMRDARGQDGKDGKMDPVARLESISKSATERAAGAQKLADALKPLYATFTDEQKSVAMLILDHAGGGWHGWGGRHLMRG